MPRGGSEGKNTEGRGPQAPEALLHPRALDGALLHSWGAGWAVPTTSVASGMSYHVLGGGGGGVGEHPPRPALATSGSLQGWGR